jgi:hypothetical protein
MRRLGHQPMVQKAGKVTATATAVDSAKAHSVLQSWAEALADSIEQGYAIAADYIGSSDEAEVEVNTDFSVEPFAAAPLQTLKDARKDREISWETFINGLRRFDVLPSDFDIEIERAALALEGEGLMADEQIDPVTGRALGDTMDTAMSADIVPDGTQQADA